MNWTLALQLANLILMLVILFCQYLIGKGLENSIASWRQSNASWEESNKNWKDVLSMLKARRS